MRLRHISAATMTREISSCIWWSSISFSNDFEFSCRRMWNSRWFLRYTLAWLSLIGTRISIEFNYYLLMKTYEFQVTVIDLVVMHQQQLFFQTLCMPLSLTCFFSFYILPSDYNQSFFFIIRWVSRRFILW